MEPIKISYQIKLNDEITETFDFLLDAENCNLLYDATTEAPSWTELHYKQCSHCPLNPEEHSHCPIAIQLYYFIERFHETSSIDEVELTVITEERTISQTVPLQRAIGSMLGLVSPTCGCPKMAYMKPMARFHLPLATEEETTFRVTGMYLLAQYLLGQEKPDLSGLQTIYADAHILNKAIASRLKTATESDSSKNAIALLDMYSNLVPMLIEDQLSELQNLFNAFLPEGIENFTGTKDNRADNNTDPEEKSVEALIEEEEFATELESLLASDNDEPKFTLQPKDDEDSEPKSKGKAVFKLPDE